MDWRSTISRWWVGGEGLGIPSLHLGCLVGFVVDNSGSAWLVLLVTKQLALFFPSPASGPRCVTSWPVWTRRTESCSSTSPLYLTVTCSVYVLPRFTGLWILLGDDFRNSFRISSVRQWLHVRRQSTVAFGRISYFLREGFSVPRAARTGNLNIISTSSSYDVVDGFFAAFCGIFRTPSVWT